MATSLPRKEAISFLLKARTSRPSKVMEPPACAPPAREGDDPADDLAGGLEQAHDGVSLLALAGAGLAHNAHDLVVIQVIADAADGLDLTCGGKEGDPQILDFQQLAGLFVLFH